MGSLGATVGAIDVGLALIEGEAGDVAVVVRVLADHRARPLALDLAIRDATAGHRTSRTHTHPTGR